MNTTKTSYSKVPKTFDEQVELLKKRGLTIKDEDKAKQVLSFVSYNRLSNYWFPLLQDKENEIFKDGATFETAFKLYQFDSDLRAITFQALEKIEIGVRTQIIYHLSHKYGSGFWYENPKAFKHYPAFVNLLGKICENTTSTKQEFIKKYSRKYEQFLPPSWKAFELLTFNSMLTILKSVQDHKDIVPISKSFGLNHRVFISWVETLVYIRNICAHHSRLWNIKLTIAPTWPRSPKAPWVSRWENDPKNTHTKDKILKFYAAICSIIYCLNHIAPYNKYGIQVSALLDKYKVVDPSHMGFPNDWKNEPLWKNVLAF